MAAENKPQDEKGNGKALSYWRANVRVIRLVLFVWAFVSLGMAVLFMPIFKDVILPGFQINLSFWFAHQAAIITFVALIFLYAWRMDKVDRDHDMES
jgi:putative solute:sodium symporter small subunit